MVQVVLYNGILVYAENMAKVAN